MSLTLRFQDKSLEKTYWHKRIIESIQYTRIVFVIGAFVVSSFLVKDIILYSFKLIIENIIIYALPLCVIIIGLLSTIIFSFRKYSGYIFLFSVMMSAFSLIFLFATKSDTAPHAYITVVLILLVLSFTPFVRFFYFLFSGPLIIVVYGIVAGYIVEIPMNVLYHHLFFMIIVQLVVFVARYKFESLMRQTFLKSHFKVQNELKVFSQHYRLSEREKDVTAQLLEGLQSRVIAETLEISPETVKKHIQKIFNKTGTHSRLELFLKFDSFFLELS